MDTLALNHMLNEALLSEIGEGMDAIADRLADLHGWLSSGPHATEALSVGTILEELGWWRGRVDAALDSSGTL